ncbi:MAG: hypothetical protein ABH803_00285 [Candidatus Micrarchaeota archaeon]
MSCEKWMNAKVKKLHWCDFPLIKVSIAAFTLMLAKLWTPLLSLDWTWYAVIFVITAIKPAYKMFLK